MQTSEEKMSGESGVVHIKIVSDGTPQGTRVETSDGKMLWNVIAIRWDATVDNDFAVAHLTLVNIPFEGVGSLGFIENGLEGLTAELSQSVPIPPVERDPNRVGWLRPVRPRF